MTPAHREAKDRSAGASRGPSAEQLQEGLRRLIGARGYRDVSLEMLLSEMQIEAAEFERHYIDLDACFADLWERLTQVFVARAISAFLAEKSWLEGMRAQAWEFCRFLREDHLRARICIVEVNFGGELVQAKRDVYMDAYVDWIHSGRFELQGREEIPRARSEAIVGAIWERAAVLVGRGDFDMFEMVPEMLYLLVGPYLGPEAAEEELRRGPSDIARFKRGEL